MMWGNNSLTLATLLGAEQQTTDISCPLGQQQPAGVGKVLPLGGKKLLEKTVLAKIGFLPAETSFFPPVGQKSIVKIIFPTEYQVRNIALECDCW